MMGKRSALIAGAATVLALLAGGTAQASGNFFQENAGTAWTNDANWSLGYFPLAGDYATVDGYTADVTTNQPNNILAVHVGEAGLTTGVLNVKSNGTLTATANSNWDSHVGGSGDGTLNVMGGYAGINFLEIGRNTGSTGAVYVTSGTLNIERVSKKAGYSLHVGCNDNNGAAGAGFIEISGGEFRTRAGVELGNPTQLGTGMFSVQGSGATQIGVGSQDSVDGIWRQYSNCTLRVGIDSGTNGITPILIDDYDDDGGTLTEFFPGSLLDVDFIGGFSEANSWTVMISEGAMTDYGLRFVGTVDTNDWGWKIESNTLQVAYGLGWGQGSVNTNVPPPPSGRELYWTDEGSDNDPYNKDNWDLDTVGTPATHGIYDGDHWKLGFASVTGTPAVVNHDVQSEFNQGTLAMGDGATATLNVNTNLIFAAQANNTIGINGTTNVSATINVNNGSDLQFNALRMGINGASATININDGAFLIGRGYAGSTYDNLASSIYLGWNGGGTNTIKIAGGSLLTRAGLSLGGLGTASSTGIFHVEGSGATQIGIGAHNTVNGVWNQGANGILKVRIDEGGLTPINVVVSQVDPDGKDGDVYFHPGSLLDVDWMPGVVNDDIFVVMTWDGDVMNNGLAFASNVDTNIWIFIVDEVKKQLMVAPYYVLDDYTVWANQYGLSGSAASPSENPDGDSFDNLYEYAVGGNPTVSTNTGHKSHYKVVSEGNSNIVEFVYYRRIDHADTGLTYTLELADNPFDGPWTTNGYYVSGVGSVDAEFEAVTNCVAITAPEDIYFRMTVSMDGASSSEIEGRYPPDLDLSLGINFDTSGRVNLAGYASANFQYALLRSTNLVDWVWAADIAPTNHGAFLLQDTDILGQAFYKRVVTGLHKVQVVHTADPSAPIMVVDEAGNAFTTLVDSNNVENILGVSFVASNGVSALINLGEDGLPRTLTLNDDVYYFTDWTEHSVDVWHIASNGTTNVTYNVETCLNIPDGILNARFMSPSPLLMAVLAESEIQEESGLSPEEIGVLINLGGFLIDGVLCAGSIAAAAGTGGAGAPLVVFACGAAVLSYAELVTGDERYGYGSAILSLGGLSAVNPSKWEKMASLFSVVKTGITQLIHTREDAEQYIDVIELSFLPSGLIAYYPFNGDVLDHSGNENHGSWNGGGFVTGVKSQCYSFDAGQYYTAPSFAGDLSLGTYTFSTWFKGVKVYPGWGGADEEVGLLSQGMRHVGDTFYMAISMSSGFFSALSSLPAHYYSSEYYTVLENWHHYTITYDGTTLRNYVDGQVVFSASLWAEDTGPISINDQPFYINRRDDYAISGTGPDDPDWLSGLNGEVDEVFIYNRALSLDEVQALYNNRN